MSAPRVISLFFVRLILWYALFLVLWAAAGNVYIAAYRTIGTSVFRTLFPSWDVVIEAARRPTDMWDSQLVQYNRRTQTRGIQPFGARYQGFAPTSVLMSLILASPLRWRRRGRALLWGLAAVHVWIALSIWLMIVDGYSGANAVAIYSFSPSVDYVLSFVTFLVTASTVPRYALPIFLWALVTFRRGDWAAVFGPREARGTRRHGNDPSHSR